MAKKTPKPPKPPKPPEQEVLPEAQQKKSSGKQSKPSPANEPSASQPTPKPRTLVAPSSWTGKLPGALLHEHCQRMGWNKVEYSMVSLFTLYLAELFRKKRDLDFLQLQCCRGRIQRQGKLNKSGLHRQPLKATNPLLSKHDINVLCMLFIVFDLVSQNLTDDVGRFCKKSSTCVTSRTSYILAVPRDSQETGYAVWE